MPHGLSSFVRQGIYILALFFFLSIVINAISTTTEKTYRVSRKAMEAEKAYQLLDAMIAKCFNNSINETLLDYYSSNPEKLMECANTYDFAYWVEVVRKKQEYPSEEERAVSGKRYIVMIVDTSKSMNTRIGTRTRMEIAKEGIRRFVEECTTEDDRFGWIAYFANANAGTCSNDRYLKVNDNLEKKDILGSSSKLGLVDYLSPIDSNTPIIQSLKKAVEMASSKSGFDDYRIILFTDGGDTCIPNYRGLNNEICLENAELSKNLNRKERIKRLVERFESNVMAELRSIPPFNGNPFNGRVYTVGFALSDTCRKVGEKEVYVGDVYGRVLLENIAKAYNGRYFDVVTAKEVKEAFCKSLQSISSPPATEEKRWEIGKFEGKIFTISKNVMISNSTGEYPGIVKIHIIDSNEALLTRRIELACSGVHSYFEGKLDNDIEILPDKYCFGGTCLPRMCKKEITPDKIERGMRKLYLKPGEKVEII